MTGDLIYDQALIGDGKTTSWLIGDHLTMLIGDQADWSLIGGGKTGPKLLNISLLQTMAVMSVFVSTIYSQLQAPSAE